MRTRTEENTPLALGVGVALWAVATALAAAAGVFVKLGPAVNEGLAAFAILFTTASVFLDGRLRALLEGLSDRRLAEFAALLDTVLVTAVLAVAHGDTAAGEAMVRGPYAFAPFFVLPLAVALQAILVRRAIATRFGKRLSSAPARSPSRRRAAT